MTGKPMKIKFRGICVLQGEFFGKWVYGDLLQKQGKTYICPHANSVRVTGSIGKILIMHEVDPKTVGQYAELNDRIGTEIYKGDILHVYEVTETKSLEYSSPVEFIDSGYLVTQPDGCQVPLACFHNPDSSYPLFEIEVIGNIHDNIGGESYG